MKKLDLNFNKNDVLHASQLTAIVQTINSIIENINTIADSNSSGGAAPTYDYTFEFHEGYSLGYNLVIRKYQDGKTYIEKVVPYYESVQTMENALKEKGLCTSFNLVVTRQERTTDSTYTVVIEYEEGSGYPSATPIAPISTKIAGLASVSAGDVFNESDFETLPTASTIYTNGTQFFSFTKVELAFTTEGNPKFIRCGTNIQNNGWQLTNTGDGDTIPGHGHALYDEFQRYDYPIAGKLGWNKGLEIDENGIIHNPPTEFDIYANVDYDNNGGIYKIGEWSSYMDGIEFNVAENIEGLSLVKAIRNTLTATVDNIPTTYTNDTYVHVAKDNVLMAGFTVIKPENGHPTWAEFKANPGTYLQDITKYYRTYLSDPESYPAYYDNSSQRGYERAFSRWPQSGFFDTYNGAEITYANGSLGNKNITLHEGDIFIYFKKNESLVSTRVYLGCIASANDVHISSSSYGIPGDGWQLPGFGAELMYALENDCVDVSTGKTYIDGSVPSGVTTIPAWISYYDNPHRMPNGNVVGGKNDKNGHYHGTEYTIPYEEWVNKPDGTKFYRYGGNNYQIFAFRVNKQTMKLGQLFV